MAINTAKTRPQVDCQLTLHRAYVGIEGGCPSCGRYIKVGGYTTQELIDLFGYRTFGPRESSPTPAEQKAEIAAATEKYNLAKAEHARVTGELIRKVIARRRKPQYWGPGGPILDSELMVARKAAEDRELDQQISEGEEAMRLALQELNVVSAPRHLRDRVRRSFIPTINDLRRVIFG